MELSRNILLLFLLVPNLSSSAGYKKFGNDSGIQIDSRTSGGDAESFSAKVPAIDPVTPTAPPINDSQRGFSSEGWYLWTVNFEYSVFIFIDFLQHTT